MTSWVIRFLAGVLLVIAVLAAVHDGTRTMAADRLVTTSAGEHWAGLAPTTLRRTQAFVQRTTHPLVWDAAVRPLLALPTWALFGGLGLMLGYVGRRRRRVDVFAN